MNLSDKEFILLFIFGFIIGCSFTYFCGTHIFSNVSAGWGPSTTTTTTSSSTTTTTSIPFTTSTSTSTTTLPCTPGNVCNTGNWQCDGDCKRERRIYEYDSSCNCDFDHWETENVPQGKRCSSGNFVSSGYCDYGSWSCDGKCQRERNRYRCDGSNNCDYKINTQHQNAPQGEHCSGGSFTSAGSCGYSGWSCDGNCRKRRHVYECDGSNNCDYHESWDTSNCPIDTVCSGGSCVSGQACSTGSYECKNSCTKGKRKYRCDGSNNCNEFWKWVNLKSCDPYKCSGGSCSTTCESSCGSSSKCDEKSPGDTCDVGYKCNNNCMCVDVCHLNSAALQTECLGGESFFCEEDDKIKIIGNITAGCPSSTHFQVDASSASCSIQFTGGDLSGIYGDSPSQSANSISGKWTIPSIPDKCKGELFTASSASIYSGGNPNTGTEIGSCSVSDKFNLASGCIRVTGPFGTEDEICR